MHTKGRNLILHVETDQDIDGVVVVPDVLSDRLVNPVGKPAHHRQHQADGYDLVFHTGAGSLAGGAGALGIGTH